MQAKMSQFDLQFHKSPDQQLQIKRRNLHRDQMDENGRVFG